VNNTYTLPQSSFYLKEYSPISFELYDVNQVYRTGCQLIIETPLGKIFVQYNSEFEVELLVKDILNKLKEYRAQSV
jgi:hypothetical protein